MGAAGIEPAAYLWRVSRVTPGFAPCLQAKRVGVAGSVSGLDGTSGLLGWTQKGLGVSSPEATALVDVLRQVRTCLGNAQTEATHGRTASPAFIDQCVDSAVRLIDDTLKGAELVTRRAAA